MSANDNYAPIELAVTRLDDFPDHVWIAMNRPHAIYGADEDRALGIALDIVEKTLKPDFFPPERRLEVVIERVTDAGKWTLTLDAWTRAELDFINGVTCVAS